MGRRSPARRRHHGRPDLPRQPHRAHQPDVSYGGALVPPLGIASGIGIRSLYGIHGRAGISSSVFNASFISVVQTRIEAGVLGRVLSLYRSFGLLPSAIGLLGAGFLAERIGLTTTFVLSGSIICLIGAAAFRMPAVMRLDAKEQKSE